MSHNHELDTLPLALQHLVVNELKEGEHLQWVGQPIPVFFTPYSITGVVIAIPWTAIIYPTPPII
jgi:hypothetical protein